MTVETERELRPPSSDLDIHHFMCCRDANLGLCGTDLTDTPINDSIPTTCVVCDDLDTFDLVCPYGGRCP